MREEVPSRLFRMKKGQEPVAHRRAGATVSPIPRSRRDGRVLVAKIQKASTAAQPYTLARLARFDWPSAAGAEGADRHARSRRRQLHHRA